MNNDLALKKMKKQVLEGKVQVFCLTNIEFRYLREREREYYGPSPVRIWKPYKTGVFLAFHIVISAAR